MVIMATRGRSVGTFTLGLYGDPLGVIKECLGIFEVQDITSIMGRGFYGRINNGPRLWS